MESRMVEKPINNIYDFESPEQGLAFLKQAIEEMFPKFSLTNTYNNGSYYGYGVDYTYENILIKFYCERNALGHLIIIDSKPFTLYQFDELMKDVLGFSKKNILFTLSVLKRFLDKKI